MLAALCRAGDLATARRLFDGMRVGEQGGEAGAFPNVVTYTTMIRACCARRLADEALSLFKMMLVEGVRPNRITYNTMMQGFCQAGRMELVKEVFGMDSFKPDTCTFNTLMAAHCREGRIQDAKKVFDQTMELRVRRDSASYSIVTRALCENGEFGRAEELVDSLLEKEVLKKRGGCVPLIAYYNPVFKYLCENGKAKKARLLFGQLLDIRSKVDFLAFKTLILGHCKEEDFEQGYELVLSMLKRDLMPDSECYIAVINAAEFSLFSLRKRHELGVAVHSQVLDGTSEAFQLFYELIENKSTSAGAVPRSLVFLHHAVWSVKRKDVGTGCQAGCLSSADQQGNGWSMNNGCLMMEDCIWH
uniref:Pentatricopeptide repeat-containing protein n=2 Tax=Zea mays TaxID=4577 RepID=A0A804PDV6_MAIZE